MNSINWCKDNRWVVAMGVAALVGVGVLAPKLATSQSAIDIGIDQPPSVTVIFDSSGSSQWTQEGFGTYPRLSLDDVQGDLPTEDLHRETWDEDLQLMLPNSSYLVGDEWKTVTKDGEIDGQAVDTIQSVGPCMVWHPLKGHDKQEQRNRPQGNAFGWDHPDHCKAYTRPHMCGDVEGCESRGYSGEFYSDGMVERLDVMRDSEYYRLSDDRNTPRHVLIKQVLTGTMRLGDHDGPGCWLVPRGRGGPNEQICCTEFDGNECGDPRDSDTFETYIDHRDPFPHVQEVYDQQLDDGLLDSMGSTAIFSMAAFDSFPDGAYEGSELPMTDLMAGAEFPYSGFNHDVCCEGSEGNSVSSGSCNLPPGVDQDAYCHQTGLFRMASAMNLMEASQNPSEVSQFVQRAILDVGFLRYEPEADDVAMINDFFSGDLDFFDYPIAHQPVAQASPFGAAVHDLHQFYDGGQYLSHQGGESANPHSIQEDDYFGCRARHAVLYTDGTSIGPEAPGGAGDDLGTEFIDDIFGAFGYLEQLFPYLPAEQAIYEMREMIIGQMETAMGDEEVLDIFHPRVHVVASGVEGEAFLEDDDEDDLSDAQAMQSRVLDKLSAMAIEGDTCAQYYVPREYLPPHLENGAEEDGICDVDDPDTACLVDQRANFGYFPPGTDDLSFSCSAPALVLDNEDRRSVEQAFLSIFNEVAGLSGSGAPTRPAISNFTDDTEGQIGQYRFFSGFQQSGDNPHWRGLLNRQFLQCDDQGELLVDEFDIMDIHGQMDRLLTDGDQPLERGDDSAPSSDRRRVFTSFPSILTGERASLGDGYQLMSVSDDAIQPQNPLTGSSLGYRVPFEVSQIDELWDDYDLSDGAYRYFSADDGDDFRRIVDHLRGRVDQRFDRVLGGIRFSNPVAVGPPSLDLPINSYREFRQRQSNRATMVYVSTLDGQLRAIYGGRNDQPVKAQSLEDSDDPTGISRQSTSDDEQGGDQREAWAYIPSMLHNRLGLFGDYTAPDSLMDGSPVVRDVRLCPRGGLLGPDRVCASSGGEEWRSVLVQGMGLAGQGYFALDVTRTGVDEAGEAVLPEPLVLWEFGPEWEAAQIQAARGDGESWRYRGGASSSDLWTDDDGGSTCDMDNLPEPCTFFPGSMQGNRAPFCDLDNYDEPWDLPFMASTIGEAAIGTVSRQHDATEGPVQTPVAIVGAGTSENARLQMPYSTGEAEGCGQEVLGRAIYVIDLASGELLRRFITYDGGGETQAFSGDITGTPVMSGSDPGDLSTRAFVGDENGKMYRIDMSSNNPQEWSVRLFFDPADDTDLLSGLQAEDGQSLGPAAFRPTVTQSRMGDLILIYGLGDRGQTWDSNSVQAMLAVREGFDDNQVARGESLWVEEFSEREHLTGKPTLFNFGVYFTTYTEPENKCLAGRSRIYNLSVSGDGTGGVQGGWPPASEWPTNTFEVENDDEPAKWISPRTPTLIRGLALTLGPVCELDGGDGLGQSSSPQLVAQTGVDIAGDDLDDGDFTGGQSGRVGDVGGIGELTIDLERPTSRGMPMSWSVLQR